MPQQYTPVFRGSVNNGKLMIRDKVNWDNHLFSFNGKEVRVSITTYKKSRSNNENRYYWGVVIQLISSETGAWPEDVHAEMKRMFLRVGGDKIPITRSTTELTTVEMEKYLTNIRTWAGTELNIFIPLPNEVEF